MIAKISAPKETIRAAINLPASKSLSNRTLIIRALSKQNFEIQNLSEAEDTKILLHALSSDKKLIDVGAAGTAMRFLTACFAAGNEEKILTGSERMKQRPIGLLVDALKSLGADIEYLEKIGFPPLKIKGGELTGNEVEVDGSISSQYLSALLMIAPILPNGLKIIIKGNLVSRPYAEMTIGLMKHFGVNASWKQNRIEILKQNYVATTYIVEPDWSATAFWYSVVALSGDAEITLTGLKKNSLQGDSILPELMKNFGVETEFSNEGLTIRKRQTVTSSSLSRFFIGIVGKQLLLKPFDYAQGDKNQKLKINFTNFPDLAQSLTVLAAALDMEIEFSGIENLRIKETDRITALQNELKKFGKEFVKEGENYVLKGKFVSSEQTIEPYDDHRMVMAFAPLAVVCENINIQNPETVKKSYPNFWKDLNFCDWMVTLGK